MADVIKVDVEARIARDERVTPGGEGVIELPGELLFVVSAAGVTAEGADCLQRAWEWYIERGIWQYRQGLAPVRRVTYHRTDLQGAVCEVAAEQDVVDVYLSPEHFTLGSVSGLQTAARACARSGWQWAR